MKQSANKARLDEVCESIRKKTGLTYLEIQLSKISEPINEETKFYIEADKQTELYELLAKYAIMKKTNIEVTSPHFTNNKSDADYIITVQHSNRPTYNIRFEKK